MKNIRHRKAQAAIELISSYGWVILMGIGAIIVLSQMGIFNPTLCPKSSYGFSQIVPKDWVAWIETDAVLIYVANWAGDEMQVTTGTVDLGEGVNCTLLYPVTFLPGDEALLIFDCAGTLLNSKKYSEGSCFTAQVSFNYTNTNTGGSEQSKGKIRGTMGRSNTITTTSSTTMSTTTTLVQLSCQIRSSSCLGGEACLFRLSALSNAHAGTCSGSSYTYLVCCSASSGTLTVAVQDGSCPQAGVLSLSAFNNAQVQEYPSVTYTNDICLASDAGTLSCNYNSGGCSAGYACIASMSSATNAHAGNCAAYNEKICCTIS